MMGPIQKGLERLKKTFAYPLKKGKMTQAELDKLIQDHLKTTISLEELKGVDLVIEAVLEDMKDQEGDLETAGRDLPRPMWSSGPTPPHCPLLKLLRCFPIRDG